MRRILIGMVAVVALVVVWPYPAMAAVKCQTVAGQRLCLESVKRSAKYFWQYRAVVSVAGRPQPEAVYHCQAPPLESPFTEDSRPSEPTISEAKIRAFVCQVVPTRR